MRSLRVGVDAWGMSSGSAWTGMGQYAAALLKWVPQRASIDMVAYGAPEEPRPDWLPGDVKWRVPPRARSGRLAAIASRMYWLPSATMRDHIDVFHSPGLHVRPSSPPVATVRCPLVVTVHDVIPLSYYGSALPQRNKRFYSWNLGRALKADRLLTVSESAKDEIGSHADVRNHRIEVVTSAVDFAPNADRTSLVRAGITGDYILYAGSYEPRKNLRGMLLAFDRFRKAGGSQSLVAITEQTSGHATEAHSLLASLPCRDAVRLIHNVPDSMLRALYTHAAAVAFPSLAEGLGLPPIQAAACGVPMVVSDLPVLRRTVGAVAVFARPGDPDSLCSGLIRVTSDKCTQAVAARSGPRIAARYSPEEFASDHVGVYRSCHEARHALA